jgi:hypothetical protein
MVVKIAIFSAAVAFSLISTGARSDELSVKDWPTGVPCSALQHKTDGSWRLADVVIGPDGSRHYPDPDRESRDNRFFGQKCGAR